MENSILEKEQILFNILTRLSDQMTVDIQELIKTLENQTPKQVEANRIIQIYTLE